MKKYRNILLGLLFLFVAGACEKNVDIDIDEIDPMIVMNGLLRADSTVEIYLSRTRHILDNVELSSLPGATVRISDSEGNSALLIYGADKIYRTDGMRIEAGKEYSVTASADGFNDVEATCVIPVTVPIEQIDTMGTINEWGERKVEFEIAFDDPEGVNYYMLTISARIEVIYVTIVERIDTIYIDYEKDTVITGVVYDTIEEHVPRYENVWIESEDLAIEQWDYNTNRIIFSDRLFDGKKYTFNGSYYDWFMYDAGDTSTIYISLQSIDEHYFKYIDSREDHYYAKNDPFAVPVVVHNNIGNGIGILGGMSADTDSLKVAPRRNPWDDYYYPKPY